MTTRPKNRRSAIAFPNAPIDFARRSLREPISVGSITPSGRRLSEALASNCTLVPNPDSPTIELGAGTGPVSSALLAGSRNVVLVESNRQFTACLHTRFPNADVICGDALTVINQYGSASNVVSSLPFMAMPADYVHDLVDATISRLRPGGSFTWFGYYGRRPVDLALPAQERRNRHEVAAVLSELSDVPTHRIILNFPPARVWRWTKKL